MRDWGRIEGDDALKRRCSLQFFLYGYPTGMNRIIIPADIRCDAGGEGYKRDDRRLELTMSASKNCGIGIEEIKLRRIIIETEIGVICFRLILDNCHRKII